MIAVAAAFLALSAAPMVAGADDATPSTATAAPVAARRHDVSSSFSFSIDAAGKYALSWRLVTDVPQPETLAVDPRKMRMTYRTADRAGTAHVLKATKSSPFAADYEAFGNPHATGGELNAIVTFAPVALAPGTYEFDVDPGSAIAVGDHLGSDVKPTKNYLFVPADPQRQRELIAKLVKTFSGREIVVRKALLLPALGSLDAGDHASVQSISGGADFFAGGPRSLPDTNQTIQPTAEAIGTETCYAVSVELRLPDGQYRIFSFRSANLVPAYFKLAK